MPAADEFPIAPQFRRQSIHHRVATSTIAMRLGSPSALKVLESERFIAAPGVASCLITNIPQLEYSAIEYLRK